jgi:hypothetical protein
MKTEIKSLVVKAKYHLWRMTKALEFVLRDDSQSHRQYAKEVRSKDLMRATIAHLDRLPKHDPNAYDGSWYVGTIPHDWEDRIDSKIKEKKNNVVDRKM